MTIKIRDGFKQDVAIHSALQNEKRLAMLYLLSDMKANDVPLSKDNIIKFYIKEFSKNPELTMAKMESSEEEIQRLTRQNVTYHLNELVKVGLISGYNPYEINERVLRLANPDYVPRNKKIMTLILLFVSFSIFTISIVSSFYELLLVSVGFFIATIVGISVVFSAEMNTYISRSHSTDSEK